SDGREPVLLGPAIKKFPVTDRVVRVARAGRLVDALQPGQGGERIVPTVESRGFSNDAPVDIGLLRLLGQPLERRRKIAVAKGIFEFEGGEIGKDSADVVVRA